MDRILLRLGVLLAVACVASATKFHLIKSTRNLEDLIASGVQVLGATEKYVAILSEYADDALFSTVHYPEKNTYFFAEDPTIQDWKHVFESSRTTLLFSKPHFALFSTHVHSTAGFVSSISIDFPRTTEIITLPSKPMRRISKGVNKHLAKVASSLTYRQNVADLIGQVSQNYLQDYVRFLTGEDAASPLLSRNSFSEGGVVAGVWAAAVFERDGFKIQRTVFNDLYCPNVIAELPGTQDPNKIVVVGAHLDDRATGLNDPAQIAPGANDDGSGSAMLLEIARVIAATNASFAYTLRLVAFCGEEQGLVGSRAYARELATQNADIIAMLQGDMIGYQVGSAPELSFVNRYVDLELTEIVKNITATYIPDLGRSETSACCSDHQSFFENGYPSAGYVEAGGYTIDPMYHKSGDLSDREGYSFLQIAQITKAVLSAAAILAKLN